MIYSRIAGTGSYLPEKILTNEELEKIVDTTSEWIEKRAGIKERHIIGKNETVADMAKNAAANAISAAGLDSNEIDLIIVATSTPDNAFPSTACALQKKLEIAEHYCPAFDISAACAGFVYAMSIADKFIKSKTAKNALIVGTEAMSRIINWTDRSTCILFGDGAGAVVLSASDEPGLYSTHIHADGRHEDLLYKPNMWEGEWITAKQTFFDWIKERRSYIRMKGKEVFKMAVTTLERMVSETLDYNNFTDSDIDWLIPHQANIRIIQSTAKKLNISMDKVVVTVDKHANTSAASIPLALDTAVRDGRIKSGQIILMETFGAGFVWGSALVKF